MAFPTIPTTGAGTIVGTLQANTTATRTFPAFSGLTYSAGDRLVAVAIAYQSSAAAGSVWSGWNNGFTEVGDVGGGTSSMSIGVASKIATGSETGSLTVTQAATITGFAVLILMVVSGADASSVPEITAIAQGTTTAADPAALTPSWGSADTLWISVAGWGETSTAGAFTDATASPTNYGSDFIVNAAGTKSVGNTGGAVGFRQNTAASEDASTWAGLDTSNARNSALVIAVRPAPTVITRTASDTLGTTDSVAGKKIAATDRLGTTDRAARFVHGSYLAAALAPAPLWYTRFDEVTGATAYNAARQASSFANECLADNPGLLWLFDETSGGTAADTSGNGRTGTYTGFTLNQSPLIPGDTGKSILNTTGLSGNRSVTSTYSPFDNSAPLAIEFVVANSTSGNESHVARSDGTDAIYIGTSSTSTALAFQIKSGAQAVNWSGALPFDNVAYHYVLTYDPVTGVAELWRNGLSWGTREFGVGAGWGSNPGNIMFGDTSYAGWVGAADAFAVYPGGLTRARIVAHATWLLAGNVSGGPTLGGPSLVGDPGDGSAVFNNSGGVYGGLQPFPQESASEKRTFVAVVNRTSNAGNTAIFGADVGGSGSSAFYVNTTGDVVWEPGTGFPQTWTGAWPGQNQNVHVALRAAPSNFELFINGVSQGTKSTPYQWGGSNPAARVIIGAAGAFGGTWKWVGYVDEFAMYDSHLTNAQIAGMAAAAGTSTALTRASADSLSTTDVATGAGNTTYIKTAADTLGTTDAATRSALIRTRTTADTLGTTDSAVRSALLRARTAADALGTTDFATRSDLLIRAAADVLGTSDAATRLRIEPRAAADTLGTADVATRLALLLRTAADTLGTSDTAAGFAGKRSATDTLGTTDAATRLIIAARLTADALGTTDAATRLALAIRTAADTLGTTDAATRAALLRSRTASDTLGTTDAAARAALLRARSAADTLGTTDVATRLRVSVRAAADVLGTTDAAQRRVLALRLATDTLGTSDAAARFVTVNRTASDTLGTTDTADAILDFVTAPDLYGPLHVLVLSDGVLTDVITLEYVAKSPGFEPTSKTVQTEPHQKIDLLEPHSVVELLDYAGKVS